MPQSDSLLLQSAGTACCDGAALERVETASRLKLKVLFILEVWKQNRSDLCEVKAESFLLYVNVFMNHAGVVSACALFFTGVDGDGFDRYLNGAENVSGPLAPCLGWSSLGSAHTSPLQAEAALRAAVRPPACDEGWSARTRPVRLRQCDGPDSDFRF